MMTLKKMLRKTGRCLEKIQQKLEVITVEILFELLQNFKNFEQIE